jgi:GT2 family glycosyltransferase
LSIGDLEIYAAVVFAALGALGAGFAIYYVVVAIASFFYRGYPQEARGVRPRTRVAVLVPAHDEAALIARCVRSLLAQAYPSHLYGVIVVADNCTDDTASIARFAGAETFVRDESRARGKGRALRWLIDQVLQRPNPPDAVVVVDADAVADPDFLAALVRPFESGATAVQGESLLAEDGSPAASLRAAAFLLFNRVRPAGRSVLRLPCDLTGNGMLLSSELLRAYPWDAFTSAEDLEYTFNLRMAGVRPVFAGGAILHSPSAPSAEAATHQQLRWEGGKLHVAKKQLPRLVREGLRRRDRRLLGAAFDLAVPPLGLLSAGAVAATVVGVPLVVLGALPMWSLGTWLATLVAIPLYVLLGLRAARAPRSAYRSLARAPWYVVRKVLNVHRLLKFDADTWVRTDRGPHESKSRV